MLYCQIDKSYISYSFCTQELILRGLCKLSAIDGSKVGDRTSYRIIGNSNSMLFRLLLFLPAPALTFPYKRRAYFIKQIYLNVCLAEFQVDWTVDVYSGFTSLLDSSISVQLKFSPFTRSTISTFINCRSFYNLTKLLTLLVTTVKTFVNYKLQAYLF